MPPIEIILNDASGTSRSTGSAVSEIFAKHGLEVHINEARPGEQITDLAQRAATSAADIVVAGGGDGTVGTAAAALPGSGKKLGVLPLGTLNHFAKDLRIPISLEAAVEVIAGGHVNNIDIGDVNGRVFINNSSLGLYPAMVRGREMRQRLGYAKWEAALRSALAVFKRYPLLDVSLETGGKHIVARTPFVFIGNNEYAIEGFNIGRRERLDGGQLSVYITRRSGRLRLFRIALKSIFGRLSQEKDFLSVLTEEVLVQTRHKQIRVAMDGEVLTMETPLRYKIRAGALQVIVLELAPKENVTK